MSPASDAPTQPHPAPMGSLTLFEYVQRVRHFRRAVDNLAAAQRSVFLRKWPAFETDRDPLMWNDDKTRLAERYWRDATGNQIPQSIRPPSFSEVRALRTRDEALNIARDVQRRIGGFTARTQLAAGPDNRGGPPLHYNDLNNEIFHDAREMLSAPTECLYYWAGHETGHTLFYPGSLARAEFDRGLMEMIDQQTSRKWFASGTMWGGKRAPDLFSNWLGDQIINYRMQYKGAFGMKFHKGMLWLLSNDPHRRESRGSDWFMKMHFRLLWASAIKFAGGYHDGSSFVRVHDVAELPPLLVVNERAFPQVTYHDGPAWLRLPSGKYRLVELWRTINTTSPASVEKNLARIMDLVEPFYFPPQPPAPAGPTNPDGVLCPRCKKADQVRIVPDAVPDPQHPGAYLARLECDGCSVHKEASFRGVWEYDRDANRSEKIVEA